MGVWFFTLFSHPFFPLLYDNGVNWQEAKLVYYTVTVMYWSMLTTRSLDPVIYTWLIFDTIVHCTCFTTFISIWSETCNLIKYKIFYYCTRKLSMSILDPAIAGCVVINNRPVTVVSYRKWKGYSSMTGNVFYWTCCIVQVKTLVQGHSTGIDFSTRSYCINILAINVTLQSGKTVCKEIKTKSLP